MGQNGRGAREIMPHWCRKAGEMPPKPQGRHELGGAGGHPEVGLSLANSGRFHASNQRQLTRIPGESAMLIRAGYEIVIECDAETPLMALLSVHPSRAHDLRSPAVISSSAPAPLMASLDEFGNLRTRTTAPVGRLTLATD